MKASETNRDILVRMSQFIFRKESEALAKEIQNDLVKTVLFTIGNTGLSVPEIIEEIDKQMDLKDFPSRLIQNAVKRLCDEKEELRKESGKYFLTDEEYEKINKTINERRRTLEQVESVIKAKIQEKLKKTKADTSTFDIALGVLYKVLVTWFKSESNFVANLLSTKKKVRGPYFPVQVLNKTLKRIKDNNLKQAIQSTILEIFAAPESAVVEFLYTVLQNYLHLELLNIDPECKIFQKAAFSKKTLVLDTNILMALFLKADRRHEGTRELVSLAQDLEMNLVFTEKTKQEWMWTLEKANEEFKTANSTRPGLLRRLDDVFVRSYFREKTANISLLWQGFYLQMRQVEALAKRRQIGFWHTKEFDLDNLPNKEFYEPLSRRVHNCATRVGNPKAKRVSEHDAYHILLVRKKREEQPADALGPSCWFLTHDTSLVCADEGLNKFIESPFDPPSSFVADIWIAIIGPFLGPKIPEQRLAEAFTHLMKTHFAAIPSELNARKMVEVLGHWLPYETLTDTDIEAILSDSLVTKYYDELKEARIREPHKVEKLRGKLREEVDRKVSEVFDEKVTSAEKARDEAKELALKRQRELIAERRQRKLILWLCAILGGLFAACGLLFSAIGNLAVGVTLTLSGIVFIALALTFRYFKFKVGPFEIEAKQ